MGTYIMTVLPVGTDLERAKEEYKRSKLHFWLQEMRPPAVSSCDLYVGTAGFCDCGTALGSARIALHQQEDPERHIPKLRKRGWGETKINRWLGEKQAHLYAESAHRDEQNTEELARWHGPILRVLESGLAPWIGVFVHFYNEGPGVDIIHNVERVPVRRLTPNLLQSLADDTLYEFMADTARGRAE